MSSMHYVRPQMDSPGNTENMKLIQVGTLGLHLQHSPPHPPSDLGKAAYPVDTASHLHVGDNREML